MHARQNDTIRSVRAALLRGDEKALALVYREYGALLVSYARRRLNTPDAAEDIVQEAFIAWWNRREQTPGPEAVKAYLYTCVRNACYNHNRDRACRLRQEQQQAYLVSESPAEALRDLVRAETLAEIYALVRQLPPRCREVFELIYLKEKTNPEVAAALRISESTIRTQKARALALLRQLSAGLLGMLY